MRKTGFRIQTDSFSSRNFRLLRSVEMEQGLREHEMKIRIVRLFREAGADQGLRLFKISTLDQDLDFEICGAHSGRCFQIRSDNPREVSLGIKVGRSPLGRDSMNCSDGETSPEKYFS